MRIGRYRKKPHKKGAGALSDVDILGVPQAASAMLGIYNGEHDNESARLLMARQLKSGIPCAIFFSAVIILGADLISMAYGLNIPLRFAFVCMSLGIIPALINCILSSYYNVSGRTAWANAQIEFLLHWLKENRRRKWRYKMKELTLSATIENIAVVTDFIDEQLEQYDCPMKTLLQINVAIDELFSNIANYAYVPDTGMATVQVEFLENPLAVVITFIDKGIPFDPLNKPDPDVTLPLEERRIGGLGIYMVKNTMDDISYEYINGQNILKIRKII